MSENLIERLSALVQGFVDDRDQIAVIIQSKSDPAISIGVNETLPIPSASIVKTAIACAAADEGEAHLSKTMKISDLDDTFYCSIIHAFDQNEQISIKTLIGLMLIVSDNPATSAVVGSIGMDKVNHWLRQNDLSNTKLSVGFDDASLGAPLRANLTTAVDCLRLLRNIDTRSEYTFIKNMLANNLRNERIPKFLPEEVVIAHKTGTLNGLAHDMAIIDGPNTGYYVVILADGLPQEHDFANEIARFSKQAYALMSA